MSFESVRRSDPAPARRLSPRPLLALVGVLLALSLGPAETARGQLEPVVSQAYDLPAAAEGHGPAAAELVGSETCLTCHDDEALVRSLAHGPHGSAAFAERSGGIGCESCHGPGGLHAENPDDPAHQPRLDRLSAAARTDGCLDCHGDVHPGFRSSPHALAGLSCTDCHAIHDDDGWSGWDRPDGLALGRLDRLRGASAVCAECHGDVAATFELNERHRLHEGILSCTSCHDPHERQPAARLAGVRRSTCEDCHVDQTGPFVFEHASLRVEGCTACHTPHGSPNRHLLTFQSVAELCYSCHAGVPAFHIGFGGPVRFDLDTQCTNCHSAIHGSNFDPAFLQ